MVGSIRVARMAGIKQASTATPMRPMATAANVDGSIGLTWNSMLLSKRVAASAPTIPPATLLRQCRLHPLHQDLLLSYVG